MGLRARVDALTDGELERLERSTEVNSKPLQVRKSRSKLGSLVALVVLVQETPVGSGTGWDWIARPVRARWKCSFSRSHGRDPSPVGRLLSKLDPMVVVGKVKRSFLEAFLGQPRPPLRAQLAESVGVATPVVCRDAPTHLVHYCILSLCHLVGQQTTTHLHGVTGRPSCGHDVPEWKVLGPGSVPVPASRTIASLPGRSIWWATTGVSTGNSTPRVHWCTSRCPSTQNRK